MNLESYAQVLWLSGEILLDHLAKLGISPPVTGVVTRAAVEVSSLKIEIFFLANSAQLWVLSIEFFEAGA